MNVSLIRAAISHPGEALQALLVGPGSLSMGSSLLWGIESVECQLKDMYRFQKKEKKKKENYTDDSKERMPNYILSKQKVIS